VLKLVAATKATCCGGGHGIRNMQYDVGSTERWEDYAPVIT